MTKLTRTFNGTVHKELVAKGSKSERTAVVLHTAKAKRYVLRVAGDNPFDTSALEEFVGKKISVKDAEVLHGSTLLVKNKSDISVKR